MTKHLGSELRYLVLILLLSTYELITYYLVYALFIPFSVSPTSCLLYTGSFPGNVLGAAYNQVRLIVQNLRYIFVSFLLKKGIVTFPFLSFTVIWIRHSDVPFSVHLSVSLSLALSILYTSGMSNVRPANGLNAAREMIFSYVMHAARERMKYIKHAARELISYVMHAAREMILQSIKKKIKKWAVHLWNLPKNVFDGVFF